MGEPDFGEKAHQMRERGVEPLEEYPGSNNPWKCRCHNCGEIVTPRYATVVSAGKGGCNFCAKRAAGLKRSAEAGIRAVEMASKSNVHPLEPYPGAHSPWLVECELCGNVWSTPAQSIARGSGCRICRRNNAGIQQKISKSTDAVNAMIAAELQPLVEYPGANNPWLCKCLVCGELVEPRYAGISSGQGGCRNCGVRKSANSRRTSSETAYLEMLAASVSPDDPNGFENVMTPWPGHCLHCGLPTRSSLSNVRAGHGGCKRCALIAADSAYDFFGESIFYLIVHEKYQAGKIGIAGAKTKRIQAHQNQGWTVVQTLEFDKGFDAWYLEGAVLAWIRGELEVPAFLSEDQMPQGGFTETFALNAVDIEDLIITISHIWETRTWLAPVATESQKQKARRSCALISTEQNCQNPHYSSGYCVSHYRAFKLYGDPLVRHREIHQNKTCLVQVDGQLCNKAVDRKGMCSVHYYRAYTYGDPLFLKRPTPQPLPDLCVEGGCEGKPYALGRCSKHYHASRKAAGKG